MLKRLIAYIKQFFGIGEKRELSYSKIKTYSDCSYRYFLVYEKGLKAPPSPHSSLGSSIHTALELFHHKGGKTLSELLQAYHDGWEHEGFTDAAQTMEFFQRGEEILRKYFEIDRNRKSEILFTEKKFRIDLSFCFLRGIIDRIDRHPNGMIEVIDYKTHRSMWKKKDVENDFQLTVYSLACKKDLGLEPGLLTYYFLSKGRKISTYRTHTDEKKLVALLKKICKNINKKKFYPNPKVCYRCDFTGRCPYAKKNENNSH